MPHSANEALPPTPPRAASSVSLERMQVRQLVMITAGAVAIFFALRLLPTGTNLSHMDFRVDPRATNAIEFCDPLNPQFIPVVAAKSPVTMSIVTDEPARVGHETHARVTLKTGSGKPIAPEDLLVTHTRKLHLLVVDPSLQDYQHVHPAPAGRAGDWSFAFTARRPGTYRVFADFTPAATARGLYASADLDVPSSRDDVARSAAPLLTDTHEQDGIVFGLRALTTPVRAGQPIDLRFSIARRDGGTIPLEPVMGAFAHLVAFDETRSGFAHLHPAEIDLSKSPDPKAPVLNFKLTIPKPGRYVVWAQVNIAGNEQFVPFPLSVE